MKVFYRLNLNSYIKSKSILLIISFTHLQLSNISVSTIFRGFMKEAKTYSVKFYTSLSNITCKSKERTPEQELWGAPCTLK